MAVRHIILAILLMSGLGIGLAVGLMYVPIRSAPRIPMVQYEDRFAFNSVSPEPVFASALPVASDRQTSLLFLGDVMLDRHVAERIQQAGTSTYPFAQIIGTDGRIVGDQHAIVVNLEGPVTSKRRPPEKTIDFAFDPSVAQVLKSVGITAVSQANNHTLDQGREGADDSRRLVSETGIAVFGDEVNDDEASAMTILQVGGRRVALLGFNTTDNPLNETDAARAIASATGQADHVIVMMHWGEEYQAKPTAAVVARAHWLVDHGADAVIGGHPHWMQSVEVYRQAPIVYSLGNAVFDQDWSSETNFGLAVRLNLTNEQTIMTLHPIQIIASQPTFLDGVARQARLDRLAEISDPSLSQYIKSGVLRVERPSS